ncbi:MAG: single-stranded DNA-binding protein [Alistipes senegalensis]|nr:single-stranded DNA-binding protein [Alistipes senegalensis]
MTSINKIILIGQVMTVPVYHFLPSGKRVARLILKTYFPDETAEKHRILLYGKLGEFALKNLAAGMQLYVEGRLQYRYYTNWKGWKQEQTHIIAHRIRLLSRKKDLPDFQTGISQESQQPA